MLRYLGAFFLMGLFLVLGGLGALVGAAENTPAHVTAAVQSPMRPRSEIGRDADRKPAEVLAFARIKPGDKVALLLPDTYYTRILSRLVGSQGKVYAVEPIHGIPAGGSVNALLAEAQKAKQAGKPLPISYAAYNEVLPLQHTTDFNNLKFIYATFMPAQQTLHLEHAGNFPVPEQLDAVFTSQGYHTLHNKVDGPANNAPLDMVEVNKAIFRTMKPGGVYIVSDYAAPKDAGFSQTQELNRSDPEAVKQEVLAAGFVFDGESKVLASEGDDRTSAASGDKADQFVLRFRKPANASAATKRVPMSALKMWDGNTFVSGTADQRSWVIFFHADGKSEEVMASANGDAFEYESVYFDSDGNYCNYHEIPQEGFTTCYPWVEQMLKAKVGEYWTLPPRGSYGLAQGYVYPTKPTTPARGRGE